MASKIIVDQIEKTGGSLTALTLPTSNASASQYLQNDGSGNLSWATVTSDTNTPCWLVGLDADQAVTDGVQTIAELDDVEFNVGFTWDTTGFKGIPGAAGKYMINCFAHMGDGGGGLNLGEGLVSLFVNTVETCKWGIESNDTINNSFLVGGSVILDLGATDYLQMKCYIEVSSTTPYIRREDATLRTTYMSGMKLIEA